jgi:hypothetical protein
LFYTAIAHRLQSDPSSYLKKMYFDAVSYSVPALQSLVTQVSACELLLSPGPFRFLASYPSEVLY